MVGLTTVALVAAPAALLTGAAGLTAMLISRIRRERTERRRATASRLGLQLDGTSLHGEWEGRRVWVFFVNLSMPDGRTVEGYEVAMEHEVAMAGLMMRRGAFGRMFSRGGRSIEALPGLVMTGPNRVLASLLSDSSLVQALARAPVDMQIEESVVRVRTPVALSVNLPQLLAHARELSECVDRAAMAPWEKAAAHFELKVQGTNEMAGRVGRCSLVVASGRRQSKQWTEVVVAIRPELADGGIRAGDGGVDLGDPVLGGKVAVRGDAATRLLGRVDDDLRSSLLEVFVEYPTSEVNSNAVVVRMPGRAMDELGGVIYAAVVMAHRLSDPASIGQRLSG